MLIEILRFFQLVAIFSFFIALIRQPNIMSWKEVATMSCFLTFLAGHSGKVRVPRLLMVASLVVITPCLWLLFMEAVARGLQLAHMPNFLAVLIGTSANVLVVLANRGYMPVDICVFDNAMGKKFVVDPRKIKFPCSLYKATDQSTRMHFLCDRLQGLPLMPKTGIFSVGDVLILYGILYMLIRILFSLVYSLLA